MATLDQPTRDILDRLKVSTDNAPAVTPALLAYLRGLGMDMSTAEDIRAQRISRLGSDTTEAVSKQERAYDLARTGTTNSLIAKGTLRSGEAGTKYGRLATQQQQKVADIYTAKAQGTEAAEQTFGTQRDLLRRSALEQLLGAETTAGIQKATADSETRQIEAQSAAQKDYYAKLTALAQKGMAV